MTGALSTLGTNARWEVTRLRRSRRIWLLILPIVAGPIGSAVADLYLKVPSVGTAQILGLFITAGLSSLVILDLTALAVGEDLALRSPGLTFVLPQGRASALSGRLLVVVGGGLVGYGLGAGGSWWIASSVVSVQVGAPAPLLIPAHLAFGIVGLLVFLGGVVAAASAVTRSSSQGLVAGVLAGVVGAGVASFLLLQHQLSLLFPVALAVVGLAGFGWALWAYDLLEG